MFSLIELTALAIVIQETSTATLIHTEQLYIQRRACNRTTFSQLAPLYGIQLELYCWY